MELLGVAAFSGRVDKLEAASKLKDVLMEFSLGVVPRGHGANLLAALLANNPILALARKIGLAASMPLQNRVTPEGEILALQQRGLFMGNRGILHDRSRKLGKARWRHPRWVTCVLAFKDWHREVMQPNTYTELFFLDEATALAAGHRPCALCRRDAYLAFQAAIRAALHRDERVSADDLDRMLHAARIDEGGRRRQRRFDAGLADLPDGTMAMLEGGTDAEIVRPVWLVHGRHLLRWRPGGYDRRIKRPKGVMASVLTPRPTVLALQKGYQPALHPSAEVGAKT